MPSGCSPGRTSRRWARTSPRSRSSRRRCSRAPTSSPATIRPSPRRTARCITRSTTARSRSTTSSRSERSSPARPGRTDAEQITVADLCGVGVQDASVAAEVMRRAAECRDRQDDRAVSTATFQPFEMERWQSLYEHEVELNLADSAVRCAPLGMLLGAARPRRAHRPRALLSAGERHRPPARADRPDIRAGAGAGRGARDGRRRRGERARLLDAARAGRPRHRGRARLPPGARHGREHGLRRRRRAAARRERMGARSSTSCARRSDRARSCSPSSTRTTRPARS